MFSSQKNSFTERIDGAFDIHKDLFIINQVTDLELEPGDHLGCIKNPNLWNVGMFVQKHSHPGSKSTGHREENAQERQKPFEWIGEF